MVGEDLLKTSTPQLQDALMAKRLLAVGMIEDGASPPDVADRLGIGLMALEKWHRMYSEGGFELLRGSYPMASLQVDRIRQE